MNDVNATLHVPPEVSHDKLSETLRAIGVLITLRAVTVAAEVDARLDALVSAIVGAVVSRLAPFLSPESILAALAPALPRLVAPPLMTHVQLPTAPATFAMPLPATSPPTTLPPPNVSPDVAAALLRMLAPQPPPPPVIPMLAAPLPPNMPPEMQVLIAQLLANGTTGPGAAAPYINAPNGRPGPANVVGWDAHGNAWDKSHGPPPVPNTAYRE